MSVEKLYEAVLDYDDDEVVELVTAELAKGTEPQVMLDDGLVAALDTVGEQFSEGTLFVPEMLMAAMERAVDVVCKANEINNLNVRIMVGGPPVTDDFAAKIGADGYGVDAPTAVDLARGFIQ